MQLGEMQISGNIVKRLRTWFYVTKYCVLNNPKVYEWKHGSLWRKDLLPLREAGLTRREAKNALRGSGQ